MRQGMSALGGCCNARQLALGYVDGISPIFPAVGRAQMDGHVALEV